MLSILLLLVSCDSDDIAVSGQGYLSLGGIVMQDAVTAVTRAVDSDLIVEITSSDGSFHRVFDAGEVAVNDKIPLEIGEYMLSAYTANYSDMPAWSGENRGEAVYYIAEQPFTIKEDYITYPQVKVPMVNYGVRFTLPKGYEEYFKSCSLQVITANRQLTLQPGETAYLNEIGEVQHHLSLTNTDGETMQQDGTLEATAYGTIYDISYSLGE